MGRPRSSVVAPGIEAIHIVKDPRLLSPFDLHAGGVFTTKKIQGVHEETWREPLNHRDIGYSSKVRERLVGFLKPRGADL